MIASERRMLNDGQSKADAEVAKEFPARLDGYAASDASTVKKIDAALGVIASWALLPGFLDGERTGPKPDTPGRQRAAKRKLQDANTWAIAMVLTRAAPEGLSLIRLARFIADADDQNQQRAARQSLQRRLLPAMRDYGLVNYELNGSGYKISATARLLVFVEKHYLPALRHDGWMHYFDADGVGEEHEES
jgi:hypothetical protein